MCLPNLRILGCPAGITILVYRSHCTWQQEVDMTPDRAHPPEIQYKTNCKPNTPSGPMPNDSSEMLTKPSGAVLPWLGASSHAADGPEKP